MNFLYVINIFCLWHFEIIIVEEKKYFNLHVESQTHSRSLFLKPYFVGSRDGKEGLKDSYSHAWEVNRHLHSNAKVPHTLVPDWYLFDNIIRYAGQRILPDVKILTPVPKSLGTASESLSLLAQLIQRSQTVNTQTYFSIFPLQHTQLHSSGPFLKQPQFRVRSHLDFHQPPASVPVLNSPLHSAPHGRGIQLHNFLAAPCL